MKNRTSRFLLLSLLALAGCVENRISIEPKSVCAPPESADTCSFSGQCEAVSLAPFFFDVGAGADRMWMFIEVENQMSENANEGNGRLNSRDAYVQEVLVSYEGGGLALSDASHRMQQLIEAKSSQVLSVYPIPDSAAVELAALIGAGLADDPFDGGAIVDVVATVKLRGILQDETEFETGGYEIPLRLCNGCLGTVGCPNVGDLLYSCPPGAAVSGTGRVVQSPASFTCVTP